MKVAPTVFTKNLDPRIHFEDPNVLVLSKPSGLLSQGDYSGEPHLVDWLQTYLGRPYVGLVHRLDRGTSGLMVIGKRTKSARRLTESLQEGKLIRKYLAWVSGRSSSHFTWTHELKKNEKLNRSEVVRRGGKGATLSGVTQGSSLSHGTQLSLVEFTLETGRSHQIRVQSAFEGHPLLGDAQYGGPKFPRIALHSGYLAFPHPISKEMMEFLDPLPSELTINESFAGSIPSSIGPSLPQSVSGTSREGQSS